MPLLDVWCLTAFDSDRKVYLNPDNLPHGSYVFVDSDWLKEQGVGA